MRSILTSTLLLLALALAAPRAQAQSDPGGETIRKTGTTAAPFLKLGLGARAVSLGGTFVAEASDLSALYWNAAGLGTMRGSAVQFSHTQYLADIDYNYAAFGTRLGGLGTVALAVLYLDSGEMDVRTETEPDGTGERFHVRDLAIQLAYGRALTDRFSIGGSVKYIREQVWHSTASTVALDIGVLFRTPWDRLKLGASMTNFGPKMQMDGRDILFSEDPNPEDEGNVEVVNARYAMDRFELPLLFRVGVAWDAVTVGDHALVMMTDAAHPNDNQEYMNVGGEYRFRDLLSLRAGYRDLFVEDAETGLTFGGGLNVRLDRTMRIALDYAYADFGRLEETHWFTVEMHF